MPIIHFNFTDETLHGAAKIAAHQRRISLKRYVMDAVRVLVAYDAQSDDAVKAALKEKRDVGGKGENS